MTNTIFDKDEKVLGIKLDNIEYIERSAVYGIVINNKDEVAVIRTPGGFFLPGGGIENSETHTECLHREFIEETGYEVEIGKFIGRASLYHTSRTNQYIHGTGYFYFVNLKNKTSCKSENDHEMMWLEAEVCIEDLFLEHQSWAVAKALRLTGRL